MNSAFPVKEPIYLETMFRVKQVNRHALASFAVEVKKIQLSLLPETESGEAQFVLAWELTHAFSHSYCWNIKTTGQPGNSEKPNC